MQDGFEAMNELEIIDLIRRMASDQIPGVEIPPGDDAAAFHFSASPVFLTMDTVFEGIHFSRRTYSLGDVGWKATAAGVSDIAAMGGEPSCILVSLGFGEAPAEEEVRSLVGGVLEMASWCNCSLIGGDVCRSGGGMSVTVAVAGIPSPAGPVMRSGALEGDVVGVTGNLGDSAAGLFVLGSERDGLRADYPALVEKHLRPRPRIAEGVLLARAGVSAMEDVSDGLAADICHVCAESGLGCRLEAGLVPISGEARSLAAVAGEDPLMWALEGGEDFELVFTSAPERFGQAVEELASSGCRVTRIGTMVPVFEGRRLTGEGRDIDLEGMGYDHFE